MNLLGIDNIFFNVNDLKSTILFYQKLGFKLKFAKDDFALFSIGNEAPGLILSQSNTIKPGRFWVEVSDALRAQEECNAAGIEGKEIETATGITFEVKDEWGNRVGFADYTKKPELARQ